jgi:hypothetical protein
LKKKKKYFTARNGGGGISFRFSNFPRASEREQRAHTHTHTPKQFGWTSGPDVDFSFDAVQPTARQEKREATRDATTCCTVAAGMLLWLLRLLHTHGVDCSRRKSTQRREEESDTTFNWFFNCAIFFESTKKSRERNNNLCNNNTINDFCWVSRIFMAAKSLQFCARDPSHGPSTSIDWSLFIYFFLNLDCYPLADFLFYLCDIGNNGVQRTTRKRLNGNDPGLHFLDLHKYQSKREIQICKSMIYTYLLDFWLGKWRRASGPVDCCSRLTCESCRPSRKIKNPKSLKVFSLFSWRFIPFSLYFFGWKTRICECVCVCVCCIHTVGLVFIHTRIYGWPPHPTLLWKRGGESQSKREGRRRSLSFVSPV